MRSARAATKAASAMSGVAASQFQRRRAARQPQDMPRKQAIRTTLVKNCRKMTFAENQRMQASSKNRTRNPTRKRLRLCWRSLSP